LIVVDASNDSSTRSLCQEESIPGLVSKRLWIAAEKPGAASQRNQGVPACSQSVIGFFDDDIVFEADCIARLWGALQSDSRLGGVNAMIVNQRYGAPGRISRFTFRLMAGRAEPSYAGRVIGPAVNLLPEDRDDLPEVVTVDWLNLGCTLYRREALGNPPFPECFTGYSLMEDLTLSLTVGKRWKLANARTARIFHDSQPGSHKSNPRILAEMYLLNRYYIMKHVLRQSGLRQHGRLAIWMAFRHLSLLSQPADRRTLPARLRGEWDALKSILSGRAFPRP
jgi:glycosyltransferase involved in cell wall biosynthesis